MLRLLVRARGCGGAMPVLMQQQQQQMWGACVRRGLRVSALARGFPEHEVVVLPALSPTMETGSLSAWRKGEGEAFEVGDILCEVETDKATVDFETQEDGYIAKILVPAQTGEVKVGAPIMVSVQNEEDIAAFANFSLADAEGGVAPAVEEEAAPAPTQAAAAAAAAPAASAATPATAAPASAAAGEERVRASPFAKKLARDGGVQLSQVSIVGTGPQGRILGGDVQDFIAQGGAAAGAATATAAGTTAAAPTPTPAPAAAPMQQQMSMLTGTTPTGAAFTDEAVSEEARQLAAALTQSKQQVPHYYLNVDLDMRRLLEVREELNAARGEDEQLSVNDFVVKAAALAMRSVPDANASWMDSFVRRYTRADVNVIIGEAGSPLVAPVVRDAGSRGLHDISNDIAALARRSSEGGLTADDMQVGTFSVYNFGAFGLSSASVIIREPQAVALAVGAIEDRVIPNPAYNAANSDSDDDSEEMYLIAPMMTATLSCDHRVIDGAVGAQWLAAFKKLIDNPMNMLL